MNPVPISGLDLVNFNAGITRYISPVANQFHFCNNTSLVSQFHGSCIYATLLNVCYACVFSFESSKLQKERHFQLSPMLPLPISIDTSCQLCSVCRSYRLHDSCLSTILTYSHFCVLIINWIESLRVFNLCATLIIQLSIKNM